MVRSPPHGKLEVLGRRLDAAGFEVQHQTLDLIVPNWLLGNQPLRLEAVLKRFLAEVTPAKLGAPHNSALVGIQAWDMSVHAVEDAISNGRAVVLDKGDLLLSTAIA